MSCISQYFKPAQRRLCPNIPIIKEKKVCTRNMELDPDIGAEFSNKSEQIVVRTMFNHESRFIILPSDDFSLDSYMRAGSYMFKIGCVDEIFIGIFYSSSEIQNQW